LFKQFCAGETFEKFNGQCRRAAAGHEQIQRLPATSCETAAREAEICPETGMLFFQIKKIILN
jgi:hypothetical protein